jgi:pyruvate carboxylase
LELLINQVMNHMNQFLIETIFTNDQPSIFTWDTRIDQTKHMIQLINDLKLNEKIAIDQKPIVMVGLQLDILLAKNK